MTQASNQKTIQTCVPVFVALILASNGVLSRALIGTDTSNGSWTHVGRNVSARTVMDTVRWLVLGGLRLSETCTSNCWKENGTLIVLVFLLLLLPHDLFFMHSFTIQATIGVHVHSYLFMICLILKVFMPLYTQ